MSDNNNNSKLNIKLDKCSRCGNPFFAKDSQDLVCENCLKLEQRKKQLQLGVFENVIKVENEMEDSIKSMLNQLTINRGKFNKQFFLEQIKKRFNILSKSIELIEKIEDTKEEKFIDEFKQLFEKIKKEQS